MAEEFQVGVWGGNWWNSPRNLFGSSPCSSAINDIENFGWPSCHDPLTDAKSAARSSDIDSAGSASDGSSVVLQNIQKTQRSIVNGSLSSPNMDHWHQNFLHDGQRSGGNYSEILQQNGSLNSSMNYEDKVEKDWNSDRFCQDFYINSFGQRNQDFPSEHHQPLNSTANCQELSVNLPLDSASYNYNSSVMQNLLGLDSQPQQPLLDDQEMSYFSTTNYGMNSNEFLSPNNLHFTNNTPLWNATAAALSNTLTNFVASTQTQFIPSTVNDAKNKREKPRKEEGREAVSDAKKSSCNEPSLKRPRMETPSPLPTFKVRKEKLGDRITALQQLVSPFGKTDTASVLHEAIDYIKFLHDQINVLTAPYLKNGPHTRHHQQVANKLKDQEGVKKDLSSRGLCLVPISITFRVTAETTSDFWTPSFGGSLR